MFWLFGILAVLALAALAVFMRFRRLFDDKVARRVPSLARELGARAM